MTTISGNNPTVVVSIMRAGGANRINQQMRPPSVSPRQPNAGKKPMVSPEMKQGNKQAFNSKSVSFVLESDTHR